MLDPEKLMESKKGYLVRLNDELTVISRHFVGICMKNGGICVSRRMGKPFDRSCYYENSIPKIFARGITIHLEVAK